MCLDDEESFTIRGLKVLCPSLFNNTVVHISVTIVNQVYERSELMSKAKFIIHLVSIHNSYIHYTYTLISYVVHHSSTLIFCGLQILKNKFLLPNGLECKMNIFLNQN